MVSMKEAFNKLRSNLIKAWRAPKDWISKSVLGVGITWFIIDIPFPDMSGEIALLSSTAFVIGRSIKLANAASAKRNNKLHESFAVSTNEHDQIEAIRIYALDAFKWGRFTPHHIAKKATNISIDVRREDSFDDWADREIWADFNRLIHNPQAILEEIIADKNSCRVKAGGETLSIAGQQYSYSVEYDRSNKEKLLGFIPLPY